MLKIKIATDMAFLVVLIFAMYHAGVSYADGWAIVFVVFAWVFVQEILTERKCRREAQFMQAALVTRINCLVERIDRMGS